MEQPAFFMLLNFYAIASLEAQTLLGSCGSIVNGFTSLFLCTFNSVRSSVFCTLNGIGSSVFSTLNGTSSSVFCTLNGVSGSLNSVRGSVFHEVCGVNTQSLQSICSTGELLNRLRRNGSNAINKSCNSGV